MVSMEYHQPPDLAQLVEHLTVEVINIDIDIKLSPVRFR